MGPENNLASKKKIYLKYDLGLKFDGDLKEAPSLCNDIILHRICCFSENY